MPQIEKAYIAQEVKERGKDPYIRYIELESDGHITNAGPILLWYWNEKESIDNMISGGDLYLLSSQFGRKHSLSQHFERRTIYYDYCVYQVRDLKQSFDKHKPKEVRCDDKKWLESLSSRQVSWVYLYKNKTWTFAKVGKNSIFRRFSHDDINALDMEEYAPNGRFISWGEKLAEVNIDDDTERVSERKGVRNTVSDKSVPTKTKKKVEKKSTRKAKKEPAKSVKQKSKSEKTKADTKSKSGVKEKPAKKERATKRPLL